MRSQKKRYHGRPKRRFSCADKEKMTKQDAIGKAGRLFHVDGARMTAYRCLYRCYLADGAKAWHVGHR